VSNEKSSVDELAEKMGELSAAERRELLESVQQDLLERYLEVRGEYIDDLRERGLVGLYPEESPWAAYCRDHPEDPICLQILPQEGAAEQRREYLDARREYVERLREEGLTSFGMSFDYPSPGPVPLTHREQLRFPQLTFCDRYPEHPICDPDYLFCRLFPCHPRCGCNPDCWSTQLRCECNPFACFGRPRVPLPDAGFPSPRITPPAGFGGDTMSRQQAGGLVNPMGFSPGLTPIPDPIPEGAIPEGQIPGPFPRPRLDLCRRYPCLCDPYSCACNPYQPRCLNSCWTNPFTCECNPELPWCDPWWGFPDPRDLGAGASQPRPAPGFGGMMAPGGATTGTGYPMRSMGAYPYGY
jgi:hypothetical protein